MAARSFRTPLRRRVGSEEFLGQADRAEWQRNETLEQPVGAERELERAAADVHHDGSADAELEVRERAAERQPCFLLAAQHLDLEPGLGAHELEERQAVGGVAHRARRDGFDA